MRAQHAVKAGLAGEVDALIGQCRDDPCRRHVGKARLVGDGDDARPFGGAQRVRRNRANGVWPAISPGQAFAGLPALEGPDINVGHGTNYAEPRAGGAGRANRGRQGLAVFQAGHASSPSRKTAESFFANTSKAAVSASALSLRCNSRSSSFTRRRSCRASTALAARGSPTPAIASCFQASSSAGDSPCSRHHALRVASSIAAVAITSCSRAAAVQRWLPPPGPLAKASARQRSNVATLTPTSHETISTDELSGGSSRATILSLYTCPYRATACYPRPQRFRSYPRGNCSDTGGAQLRKIQSAHLRGIHPALTPCTAVQRRMTTGPLCGRPFHRPGI